MSCKAKIIMPLELTASDIMSHNITANDDYDDWTTAARQKGDIVKYGGNLMWSNIDANSSNKPVLFTSPAVKHAFVPNARKFEFKNGSFVDLQPYDHSHPYAVGDRFYNPAQNDNVFETVVAGAGNRPPLLTDSDYQTNDETPWLHYAPENPMRLFDLSTATETLSDTDTLTLEILPSTTWSHVALFGLKATSITINVTDNVSGDILYTNTETLIKDVKNWWEYWKTDREKKLESIFPVYKMGFRSKKISLTINNTGGKAAFGLLVVGNEIVLGDVMYGAGIGAASFSSVRQNNFGITGINKKSNSSKIEVPMMVDNLNFDSVKRNLQKTLGNPVLLVAVEKYETLLAYGLAREFDLNIQYADRSSCYFNMETLL